MENVSGIVNLFSYEQRLQALALVLVAIVVVALQPTWRDWLKHRYKYDLEKLKKDQEPEHGHKNINNLPVFSGVVLILVFVLGVLSLT